MLIKGIRILHRCVDMAALSNARKLIDNFSNSYCTLNGGNTCLTYTFHCVSHHIADDVERHGSLVGHSMFSIEGTFGHFIRSLNGTRGFSNQILTSNLQIKNYQLNINIFQI